MVLMPLGELVMRLDSIGLKDATLHQMAEEIRRRAHQRACARCGGFGVPSASRATSTLAFDICPRCFGAGYENDLSRLAIADHINRAASDPR